MARKIVAEIHLGINTAGFAKIPTNEISQQLIENEVAILNYLNQYDFTTLSLPSVIRTVNGTTRLSNIKPSLNIPADRITAIHSKALAELYAISNDRKRIKEIATWTCICNNLDWLNKEISSTNNTNIEQAGKLFQLLRKLFLSIDDTEQVAVSVSHGDFTPWNMYCDEQRLYVYDWELAQNGIPMFFDLYHFTFQTTILQHRKEFIGVKDAMLKWSSQPLIQQIILKYRINSNTNYKLYLLFTVSHYLRQYILEKELLMQSEWMVNAWILALEDVTEIAQTRNL
jgi:thiamine kinase-like enzyme